MKTNEIQELEGGLFNKENRETNKIKEEELVKKLKDSFPDMLDFNNCLKELRKFWKEKTELKEKNNETKRYN